ncbi:MAG: PCMD domain-containing protein, partial [Odoribacter sp.]
YYVRPKYRGTVPGEASEVRTNAVVTLPNANMEQWNDYKLGTGPHNIPFYECWANGDTDHWWDSNNARSTVFHQAALVYQSTTYPTVSKTKIANSGTFAAEIRTIGVAKNNTNTSAEAYIAGKLFIGSYAFSGKRLWDGTETIQKGHSFQSKPTKLTFAYQYAAYQSGEQFSCEIEVRNQNTVLGTGSFSGGNQNGYTMATVTIDYKNMNLALPVDNIYVMFTSSNSPTGKWIKKLT